MRTLMAVLVMAAGCGAESPSGPIPTTDAATDTPPAPADATRGPCLEPRVVIYTGACVSHTLEDCAGEACAPGQRCGVITMHPPDAGPHVSVDCYTPG